ncbi:FecCD family ABC transporter permease [Microbacterium sp.]|uniref:FecCD family ABC transporter permease n=1 Tax=Microbacterium sp. TaxID=51671 RepID=UPI0039E4AAAD
MTAVTAPATEAVVVTALRRERRRTRVRAALVLTALGAVTVAGLVVEVLVGGSADIALSDALSAVFGSGTGLARFVVVETRLPRALTAVLVGAVFGLSGVVYQRLVSNVLATPDIIGVSAGASAGAVAVLVVAGGTGLAVQAGALAGAALAVFLIFGLSWTHGSSTYRLVLVGIGVGACFAAATSYLLALADSMTSTRAMRWLIGSLSGAQWNEVAVLALTLVVGVVAVVLLTPSLDALRLGDHLASGLGTRVGLVRVIALLLGAALAAIATSVAGPVAFIALVAGPIAARLLPQAGPLPAAAVGAAVLVLADVAAQTAPVISPVPTGVLTGLVGAPALIFLLLTRKAEAR